jgi:hypothetical protein
LYRRETGPDADVRIGSGVHPFYAKDRGSDLGATSWPGTLWQQGGATSWAWFTYDPDANLIYHGTVRFETQLECGIVGNPIAYTAPDGKQRIAVYTGTGWLAGGFAGAPCPDVGGDGEHRAAAGGARSPLADAIGNLHLSKAPRRQAEAVPTSGMVHVFKLP